jgi:proline racemase
VKYSHFVDCIYTHTEGEPTCIVPSGIPYPPNSSLLEKRRFLEENYDWLRKALMREPRGHKDMFGVFVTPPSSPETDAGIIWMDGDRFVDMCGHGTIALSMVMVSHGLVPRRGDITTIRLETTAGLVTSEVGTDDDRVHWTRFQNVPAYVHEQDVPVNVPGIGRVQADIVFGGNYFAIVKWTYPDLKICPENGSKFSALGQHIKAQINEKVRLRHPTQPHINDINFVTFYHEPNRPDSLYRNVHVFSDGKLDRSPGGTGTSAMMAMFAARGELGIGEPIKSEGLLGSGQFEGCLVGTTKVGSYDAFIPTVKGTASIIGYTKWLIDPKDPVGSGFVVT